MHWERWMSVKSNLISCEAYFEQREGQMSAERELKFLMTHLNHWGETKGLWQSWEKWGLLWRTGGVEAGLVCNIQGFCICLVFYAWKEEKVVASSIEGEIKEGADDGFKTKIYWKGNLCKLEGRSMVKTNDTNSI